MRNTPLRFAQPNRVEPFLIRDAINAARKMQEYSTGNGRKIISEHELLFWWVSLGILITCILLAL